MLNASLVDPRGVMALPVDEFLGFEPKSNFTLSRSGAVASMDDIFSYGDRKIPADGSRKTFRGFGDANELSGACNDSFSLPNKCNNWGRSNEGDKFSEKGTLLVFSIVCLCQLLGNSEEFKSDKLVPFSFKSSDNFGDL